MCQQQQAQVCSESILPAQHSGVNGQMSSLLEACDVMVEDRKYRNSSCIREMIPDGEKQ